MTINAIQELPVVSMAHGEVSYNGVEFNAFRRHELKGQPVYDDSERTVSGVKYTLTVGCTFFADDEGQMSALSNTLRQKLNEPGRRLVIANIGFGDIVIDPLNQGGAESVTHTEMAWGPKPRTISLEAVGGLQAIEVVWTCEFTISECKPLEQTGWSAMNYSATYREDESGITERTISGYIQIAQTRTPGMAGGKAADAAWDNLKVFVPLGFKRVNKIRRQSPDHNRLEFSIVDRQLDSFAPPPGIIDMSGLRYTVGNDADKQFEKWTGTLSGPITVKPGVSQATAARAFYNLFLSKFLKMSEAVRNANPDNSAFVDRIRVTAQPYGNEASFYGKYSAHGCLEAVLGEGGIWAPVEGSDYQQWASSMPWGNRGLSESRFGGAREAIIDVCNPKSEATINDTATPIYAYGNFSGLVNLEIPEGGGWIAYENRLEAAREEMYTRHNASEYYSPGGPSAEEVFAQPSASDPVIQYHGGPRDHVWMIGKALRIGHKPTVPRLTMVGNAPVRMVKEVIVGPVFMGCVLGAKAYAITWRILYEVDGYLKTLPPAPRRSIGCCDEDP